MRALSALVAVTLTGSCAHAPVIDSAAPDGVTVTVLGTAQDAGMPHIGCTQPLCETARERGERAQVAALGVRGATGWWLLDATPDLPAQIAAMGEMPKGIFLTHAHIGHYTGLMYLGREGLGADRIPVWCSARMASFLRENGPWSQLVALEQIELHVFRSDQAVTLEPGLELTPIPVPHRDEFSDTHAFHLVHQQYGSLLFLPDIDRWQNWSRPLSDFLLPGAILLLDGTFYSAGELPHRDPREIPHPLVQESMELIAPILRAWPDAASPPPRVGFIHLNHSNPLWRRSGAEARELRAGGFFLAERGARYTF